MTSKTAEQVMAEWEQGKIDALLAEPRNVRTYCNFCQHSVYEINVHHAVCPQYAPPKARTT